MKRYVLILCLLSVCCLIQTTHAQSPTTANNYIMESVPRSPFLTVGGLTGQPVESVNRNINYFDGLGRPLQTVLWQGSPLKRDIVIYMEYDSIGMESTQYLPYAEQTGNNGSYKPTAQTNQADYYKTIGWDTHVKKTDFPFSKTVFERSPAARTLQQGAPGAVWQPAAARTALTGRTQILEYGVNGINEVRTWNLTGSGATATTYYARGTLHKTIIKDENWVPAQGKGGTREEFRDFDQLLVLVREWEDNTQALNTYYVYDRAGLLRYTVPPGFSATSFTEASAGFDQYIYAYKYDDLGRMIEKKLPGKGWEWTVYNHSDLPVLTQDAVQRSQGKWTYTKHDRFSRIIGTGIHTGTYASPQAAQFHLDSLLALNGARWESRSGPTYTNLTFPNTNLQPLTTHYYDDYSFADASSLPAQSITPSPHIRNLQTGILIHQVDGTAPLLTVYYYDDKARMIQSAAQNHLGGTDYTTNTYSFTGELLSSKAEHRASPSGAVTTVLTTHTYDHQGRLLDTRKKVNTQAELIQSRLAYNGIGQLRQKQLHSTNNGSSFAASVDYSYNERGWSESIASGHFTQELRYDQPTAGATPQYNGNISEQHWGHGTTTPNRFVYSYDALDRLTSGISTTSAMSESMAYDNMGNITSLTRDGGTAITYSYSGNRLTALSGGISGSYTYDVNGNALTDRNGLSYTYNHLNLPKTATKTGTSVSYTYDALGTKLRSVGAQAPAQIRDYVGGFEYVGGVLERIHSEEGYINLSGSTSYHYYQQDHLGNVRSVLTPSGSSFTVIQQQDYYPYGMRKSLAGPTQNLYLYNGKEIQGELGGQYDFGARMLDPVIGRWNVVDPLAEVMPSWSPYAYGFDNPIRFIDPDGMAPRDWYLPLGEKSTSKAVWFEGSGHREGYTLLGNSEYTFGGYRLEDVEMSGSRPHPQRSIGMEGYFAGPPSGVYGPPQLTKETMRNVGTGLSFIPMTAPLGITLSLMGAESQAEAAFALAGAIPYVRAARVGWSAAKTGLTNPQLVQKSATLAERAIGGTGGVAGTAKHQYANALLNRYQSIYGSRGLSTNVYFNNGVGNRGFLDVLDRTNGIIYDFKFGNAVMSPAQFGKYSRNFGLPIQVIRP